MKSRLRLILATLLLVLAAAGSVAAQSTLPIAFSDPAPSVVLWPEPVEATILNNTTVSLVVSLQFTAFTNDETGTEFPAVELLQRYPPSITIAPAARPRCRYPFAKQPCRAGQLHSISGSGRGLGQRRAAQTGDHCSAPPCAGAGCRTATDHSTCTGLAYHTGSQHLDSQCHPRPPFMDPVCIRGL